jgi:aromatic-L-amino-acid decarboxylase
VRLLETRAEDGWTLTPATLRAALDADRAAGLVPTLVVATIGTTSTGAVDPVADLAPVATAAGAWLHVDAAWAGVAAICPARRADGSAFARAWTAGLPAADSVSTNMHKWGLTNFDCSPLWMADHAAARAALGPPAAAFAPLASPTAALDLKDLQVPLGRRMRALKLWCVLRLFGLSGLRAHIDASVALAARAAAALAADATRFRLFGEPALALVCFTLAEGAPSDALARVVDRVNASGAAFLVTSVVGGVRVGRVAVGCPDTRAAHVDGVVAALAAAVDAERGEGGW